MCLLRFFPFVLFGSRDSLFDCHFAYTHYDNVLSISRDSRQSSKQSVSQSVSRSKSQFVRLLTRVIPPWFVDQMRKPSIPPRTERTLELIKEVKPLLPCHVVISHIFAVWLIVIIFAVLCLCVYSSTLCAVATNVIMFSELALLTYFLNIKIHLKIK